MTEREGKLLRRIKEMKWSAEGRGEKLHGVKLIVGKQEVGYVFAEPVGNAGDVKWMGFVNALYHQQEYPSLKTATEDVERRWQDFVDRISEAVHTN